MSQNLYSVNGYLNVTAASTSAAETAAQTAVTAINTALTTLANGVKFSVVKAEAGEQATSSPFEFDEPDGNNGVYSAEAQLLVPASDEGSAQSLAEAAHSAITTAIASQTGTSVSLPEEQEGGFAFNLLQ